MNIHHKTGVTFVVVTHDQEEAMTLSDRIAVMDKGQVRQIGSPDRDLRISQQPVRRELHRVDHLLRCRGPRNRRGSGNGRCARNGRRCDGPRNSGLRRASRSCWHSGRRRSRSAVRGPGRECGGGHRAGPRLFRQGLALSRGIAGRPGDVGQLGQRKARRENRSVAVWEDKVWLSFEPDSAILLKD